MGSGGENLWVVGEEPMGSGGSKGNDRPMGGGGSMGRGDLWVVGNYG